MYWDLFYGLAYGLFFMNVSQALEKNMYSAV